MSSTCVMHQKYSRAYTQLPSAAHAWCCDVCLLQMPLLAYELYMRGFKVRHTGR